MNYDAPWCVCGHPLTYLSPARRDRTADFGEAERGGRFLRRYSAGQAAADAMRAAADAPVSLGDVALTEGEAAKGSAAATTGSVPSTAVPGADAKLGAGALAASLAKKCLSLPSKAIGWVAGLLGLGNAAAQSPKDAKAEVPATKKGSQSEVCVVQ